jgi:UDP-N-acetylglucosamine 1-carboxyvinyltransferase
MEKIVIHGQRRLSGEVHINGAKNSALAIIPAAIAANDICVIENLPCIEDVTNLIDAMSKLGVGFRYRDKHTLEIDTHRITDYHATYESMGKLRASYYLLGALLGRFGMAEVALPGGCVFGSRPIEQHIKGLEALGAKVEQEHGMIKARADKLTGAHIYFDVETIGATINTMLAAIYAEGVTVMENVHKDPTVVDTANFLNKLGANIKGAGTDVIRIVGKTKLRGCEYAVIPDQIEAGTFMIASAITNGDITVRGIIPKHMDALSAKLNEMNCKIEEGDDYIRVIGTDNLQSVNIKTLPYPGFHTDLHPQMAALLCLANGTSVVTETIWDRFQYVNELQRLGANINVEGRVAIVEGGRRLTGAEVNAMDLRAAAALILAGLAAEGETRIGNTKYIDRGYEDIESRLRALGADVKRVFIPDELSAQAG